MILFCIFLEKNECEFKVDLHIFLSIPNQLLLIAYILILIYFFQKQEWHKKMPKFLSSIWTSIIEYETPRLVRIHNRKLGLVRRLIQFSIGTVHILRKHIFRLVWAHFYKILLVLEIVPLEIGGPPLEFIKIQPPKMGSASRIHQHTTPQKGFASRIYQPKGVRL